jgi:chemotaxis protein histidine kinase CheA
MRAAHSIKGAAKIVGIPAAVKVAHALEDCFVAAREGRLSVSSRLVDLLFEGVDLLGQVAQDDASNVSSDVTSKVTEVTGKIERAMRGSVSDTQPASAATTRLADTNTTSTHVLRPEGSLNAAWAKAYHREIATVLRQGHGDLHFDLANVEAIDPIGLALLRASTQLAARNTTSRIHVTGMSPQMAALLRLAGLDRGCGVAAAGD